MKKLSLAIAALLFVCLMGCIAEPVYVSEEPTLPPEVTIPEPAHPPVTPAPTDEPTPTAEPTPEAILIGDQSFGVDTALLSAHDMPYDQLLSALPAFTALEQLDLGNRELSYVQVAQLKAAAPNCKLIWSFSYLGKSLSTVQESVDLTHAKINDVEELKQVLSLFNEGTKVDMSECNLKNEELSHLRDSYPAIKLVWTVHFRRWSVRTDALCFSSKQLKDNTERLKNEDVQVLSYCRDLLLLDLGHNNITDLSFILPMKNLQLIIMGDNPYLRDLSLLGQMKELIYVECFFTLVTDCSFVKDLPKLLDINLCWTQIKDISPLLDCPQLERIWLTGLKEVPEEQWEQLQVAFPQAQMDIRPTGGSTGSGWREHDRYMAYITFFNTREPQVPFLPPELP